MSAYVVDNKTISALAKAFECYEVEYKAENFINTNKFGGIFIDVGRLRHDIGQSLLDQNYKSVNFRYCEDTPTPPFEFEDVWIDEGIVYGCISCYNYQACETDDYFDSEIFKSLERLKGKMLERLIRRCGMDTEGWGYPEEVEEEPTEVRHCPSASIPIPAEEPDVVETASGICPNYDKFEAMGFDAEETLCILNMD